MGAGDLDELLGHVRTAGGYLACNLPDSRLYFLHDASLAGLWPDAETSDAIVDTLRSRLPEQFADYELDYIRDYLRAGTPELRELNPACVLGYTTVYVASDGAVRSGCYVLPPIGNILERPWLDRHTASGPWAIGRSVRGGGRSGTCGIYAGVHNGGAARRV